MARVEPEKWDEKSVELVYIAATVDEAQLVERTLTDAGIDFTIGPEEFTQGVFAVVFAGTNAGAGFFTLRGQAGHTRGVLMSAGLSRGLVEADPR